MRIIISDTSCMIDLRKAELLQPLLALPYTIAMPDLLFEDEFLCLSDEDKTSLVEDGLEVRSLSGDLVLRAQQHRNANPRLKLADCFALTLAEDEDESLLLTGDGLLKRVARSKQIRAHGVLWAIDEMQEHGTATRDLLVHGLEILLDDPLVYVPPSEIQKRIRRSTERK